MVSNDEKEALIRNILSTLERNGVSKITLIKSLRNLMKLSGGLHGLKECKEIIENMYPKFKSIKFSREIQDELEAMYDWNQKIKMIKLVRKETKMGLKEAKDYVESNWRW